MISECSAPHHFGDTPQRSSADRSPVYGAPRLWMDWPRPGFDRMRRAFFASGQWAIAERCVAPHTRRVTAQRPRQTGRTRRRARTGPSRCRRARASSRARCTERPATHHATCTSAPRATGKTTCARATGLATCCAERSMVQHYGARVGCESTEKSTPAQCYVQCHSALKRCSPRLENIPSLSVSASALALCLRRLRCGPLG